MCAVTLHIVKDTVPVYAVEKLQVHPHVENVRPQRKQTGSSSWSKMCKTDSKHTADVLYLYQHVMFTIQCMQMFNLVYISSGI